MWGSRYIFWKLLWPVFALAITASCAYTGANQSLTVGSLPEGHSIPETVGLGSLIHNAYVLFHRNPDEPNPEFPDSYPAGYEAVANLQGDDHPHKGRHEFYGHLSRITHTPGAYVLSIRGTSDVSEWIDDAKFLMTHYSQDPETGKVEQGFHEIFESLRLAVPGSDITYSVQEFLLKESVQHLTVTGHSLGSSIATLVAYFVVNENFVSNLKLVTFASPRTGNHRFVESVDEKIPNSLRIVNRADLVPKTPPWVIGYRHLKQKVAVNSHNYPHIKRSLVCNHSISTYLHILDSGIELEPSCRN